jgi:outer membrane immunogenic protein
MKKHSIGLLAFAVASVAALAPAYAADLAPKPVYKAPPPIYPMWAGFYFGGHVGGAWSDLKVTDFDEFGGKFPNRSSGAFGGVTMGINLQNGNFVYGGELDFGAMGLGHSTPEPNTGGIIVSRIGSGFYWDATARLGFAFEKALIYAKGGYAFYEGTVSITDVPEAGGFAQFSGFNGWTVGGGLEYKLSPVWSVKGEYQFFDFGTQRLVLPSDGDRYDNRLTIQTVKAGLNYHFAP